MNHLCGSQHPANTTLHCTEKAFHQGYHHNQRGYSWARTTEPRPEPMHVPAMHEFTTRELAELYCTLDSNHEIPAALLNKVGKALKERL